MNLDDAASSIRARRVSSNLAIAARDLDGVVSIMASDVSVAVAGGPTLVGRDASRAAFAEQFAERAFRGYVREPDEVIVHAPPTTATERGRWEGRWQIGIRTETLRGTYVAQWKCTELGWFIESEVFIGE